MRKAGAALRQMGGATALLGARANLAAPSASDAVSAIAPAGARHVSLATVKLRMRSVGNIGKITKAMKMVAASRLRGAQEKMTTSRGISSPFASLLGDFPSAQSDSTTVVPITSDKGLCGSINSQIVKFTHVLGHVTEESGSKLNYMIIGEKGRAQLTRGKEAPLITNVVQDAFKATPTFAVASQMADLVLATGSGKSQILFNQFRSAISFKPTIATLLTPETLEKTAGENGLQIDQYELEEGIKSEFLQDLFEFQSACVVYNAMLENSTSELGSRMQSMENSSKNAKEMLSKLTLKYNRTRQAAITTELIEIISGASALEAKK